MRARRPDRPGRATAALLAAAALAACGGESGEERAAPMAPAIEAVTLAGDPVSLAGLRGEVVLLNVWATWCVPCRAEIPELQSIHEARQGEGLRVVGVTVDGRHAGDDIREFVDRYGMTYAVWWDPDQSVLNALAAVGVPVTVLVDRAGRIVWRHLGVVEPGDADLDRALDEALRAE